MSTSKQLWLSLVTSIRVRVTSHKHTHIHTHPAPAPSDTMLLESAHFHIPFLLVPSPIYVLFLLFLLCFPSCLWPAVSCSVKYLALRLSQTHIFVLCLRLCSLWGKRGSEAAKTASVTSLKQMGHFAMWDSGGGKVEAHTGVKNTQTLLFYAHTSLLSPFLPCVAHTYKHTHTRWKQVPCPATISTFAGVLARLSLPPLMSLMTTTLSVYPQTSTFSSLPAFSYTARLHHHLFLMYRLGVGDMT